MATNTTINQPPEFLQDYYASLAERGMNMGNLGFEAYGGNRVAPMNQQQQDAAKMIQTRATSGSPEMNQASDWYSNMLAGNNGVGNVNSALGPNSIASGGQSTAGVNPMMGMNNPYLNSAIGQAQDDVSSRINSQFNGNAFGGTAHQQTLARELGNVSNNMRMGDYSAQQGLQENNVNRNLSNQQYNIGNQNQLNANNANLGFQNAAIQNQTNQFNAGLQGQNIGRQQSAMSFAPTLAANDYADASAMMGLGNQMQGQNQSIADANYQEFMRKQNDPALKMSYMQQGLNPAGQQFSNSSTTSPNQTGSPLAGAIGGALVGSQLGFSNPWLGAGAGALAGSFMK